MKQMFASILSRGAIVDGVYNIFIEQDDAGPVSNALATALRARAWPTSHRCTSKTNIYGSLYYYNIITGDRLLGDF